MKLSCLGRRWSAWYHVGRCQIDHFVPSPAENRSHHVQTEPPGVERFARAGRRSSSSRCRQAERNSQYQSSVESDCFIRASAKTFCWAGSTRAPLSSTRTSASTDTVFVVIH